MRQSVRSRRCCRMISCPAAKQIRWVNPSMATVSPSRTSSATASRIVVTFCSDTEPGWYQRCNGRRHARRRGADRPVRDLRAAALGAGLGGAGFDAELVSFRVAHDGVGVEALNDGCPEALQPADLLVHGRLRAKVEVQAVLRLLRLSHAVGPHVR